MKKCLNVIYVLCFLLFVSCGKSGEQKSKTDIQETTADKKSKPYNVFELLFNSLKEGKSVNKKLGGLFEITKVVTIIDPKSDENIYIAFLLDEKVTNQDLKGIKFQLDMFPFESDLELLREDTKQRGRNYDSWYFVPGIKSIDGSTFFYKLIDTPISDFKQVYIHAYDINTKEKIKESIVIRQLELN
jgi:hypothetical protein